MALNKKQTSMFAKIMVVMLAVALVFGVLLDFVLNVQLGGNGNDSGQEQGAQGAFETISAEFANRIAANDQALGADPADYAVLVDQGNAYFDWAVKVQSDQTLAPLALDAPLWVSAVTYYDRALKAKPGDPNVATDMAVAQFYSRDTTGAIATVEAVLKQDAKFSTALFNAGIFYSAQKQNEKAIDFFERFLEADPEGKTGNPQFAREQIEALKAGK